MKNSKTLFIFLLCLLPISTFSQTKNYLYKIIPEISGVEKIAITPEENIILMGNQKLIKLNTNGDLIWEYSLSTTSNSSINDLIVATSGDIFLSANIETNQGDFGESLYAGVLKLNAEGDSLWFKSPFINETDNNDTLIFAQFNAITQKSDGSLLLTGYTRDTANNQPLLVTQISTEGDTEWLFSDTLYYSICHYEGKDIIEASDGYLYLTGISNYTGPSIWGWYGAMLTKFDTNGNLLLNKRFPEQGLTTTVRGWSLLESQNKIILQTDDYEEETPPLSIFQQTDQEGNILTTKYFGSELTGQNLYGMYGWGTEKLRNGSFLHFGISYTQGSNPNYGILAKFDSNLSTEWVYAIGDSTNHTTSTTIVDAAEFENRDIIFTGNSNDGTFISITNANGNGNFPGFIILANEEETLSQFEVYPNPAKNNIHISTGTNKTCNYRIIGLDGRVLKTGTIQGSTELDVSKFSKGIVLFLMEGYQSKKLVIQ